MKPLALLTALLLSLPGLSAAGEVTSTGPKAVPLDGAAAAGTMQPVDEGLIEDEAPAPPQRSIFGWIDYQGVFHFVDSIDLVPDTFRAQALLDTFGSVAMSDPDRPTTLEYEKDYHVEELNKGQPKARKVARQEPAPALDKAARVTALNKERDAILRELALMEEGSAEDPQADEAELDARLSWLETKLAAVEQEIKTLQ